MRAYERFLNYVKIYTTSDENSAETPTTQRQLVLANMLCKELEEMGINATVNNFGYVYGTIPPTKGCENAKALGFVAHMDTAPAFCGENVNPIIHENYNGENIALPHNNVVINVNDFPQIKAWKGETLITADGTTLLGSDDKAGIAEIMTLCEILQSSNLPHGKICIGFTPDEEVGAGADHFDVEAFGADFAYTVDGEELGEINFENFNAASAVFDITGVSVHPGAAKNIMENACGIACEIQSLLPQNEVPQHTEGYEGFFHLENIVGDAINTKLHYIVRDHSEEKFKSRKAFLQNVASFASQKHQTANIELTITDSYFNMEQKLHGCMHLVENAKAATVNVGVTPIVKPIRGGTDGSRLSFMGLPCPNLGTGGTNFHGPYECITAERMDKVVEILQNIVTIYTKD